MPFDPVQNRRRFIPAGAGNTPHVNLSPGVLFGLSPLARGTRKSSGAITAGRPVYPRWRGEHCIARQYRIFERGLSPLARGTLMSSVSSYPACRFIPAGAGNTNVTDTPPESEPVYPRWRGEHFTVRPYIYQDVGLSPLARGTLFPVKENQAKSRFIPAGAGNTIYLLLQLRFFAVYPRWRGEHVKPVITENIITGLSPLARGTRPDHLPKESRSRFIPAGAGNTNEYRQPA